MKEMVIAGRGGQGVVLASQLLADALARAGYWVQSFPEFKAERRGAPISAFVRWDRESPIHRRYKVHECDVLAVVSASPPPQLIHSLRPGGLLVLNRDNRFRQAGEFTVVRVPASRIARSHGVLSAEGRPMANTAVLGACVRYLLPGGLQFLEQAIAGRMGRLAEANIAAARVGYAHCTRQHRLAGDDPVEALRPPTPRSHAPLCGERDRLPREPHRLMVRRAPGAYGRVHSLRGVRAVLPRKRDRAPRRGALDRRPLLQGLWNLRGRLPRPGRDRHA